MFQDFPFLTHTHKLFSFQFTIFTFCTSTLLYTPTRSPSFHPMLNTQPKNDFIYLQSFNETYLTPTFLSHLILSRMSWLQLGKEACILYLVTAAITILMLKLDVVNL